MEEVEDDYPKYGNQREYTAEEQEIMDNERDILDGLRAFAEEFVGGNFRLTVVRSKFENKAWNTHPSYAVVRRHVVEEAPDYYVDFVHKRDETRSDGVGKMIYIDLTHQDYTLPMLRMMPPEATIELIEE